MSDTSETSSDKTGKAAIAPEQNNSAALQSEAQALFEQRFKVIGNRAERLESRRATPDDTLIGPTDPNREISVTLMLKSKASDKEIDDTLHKIADQKEKPLSDAEFNKRFGADPNSIAKVEKFAKDHGLSTAEIDPNSGRVLLKGSVKDFSDAFQVTLNDYKSGNSVRVERQGTLSVPKDIALDVEGVFGLDNRSQAHTHYRQLSQTERDRIEATPHSSGPYLPPQVADAYNFPKESMGAGQSVAILEFGGGLDLADNAEYYKEHGYKVPEIQIVGPNKVGDPSGADGEVALDTQIIGSIAPDAKQMLIFGPDTEQGWIDNITRATFTQPGETPNSVISISWGDPEARWTAEQIRAQGLAFKKAALKGISIFAASGDDGAKDNSKDGKPTTDYPSADPYVTGSGGTRLVLDSSGKIKSEVTWNDGMFGGATGGGISENIPLPDYQQGVKMPANANNSGRPGRGDPDVAGNASPSTGYRVRVGGNEQSVGGTSAVSPLYAALMLRVNGALGHPAGFLNPFLYKNGNSRIFNDITSGNNNSYNAGPGWDAATGWGSINGQELLNALRKSEK